MSCHSSPRAAPTGRSAPTGLVLGVARTGAKFTPANHAATGDAARDAILRGDYIPCDPDRIRQELEMLHGFGVRYFHEHARNPRSREQSCDLTIYRDVGHLLDALAPTSLRSFGASRNGADVAAAIATGGEWARTAQAAMPLREGGAHFVTSQAAVELQIVKDMERQGLVRVDQAAGTFEILGDLQEYRPSEAEDALDLPVHSTARGGHYGRSSAAIQLATLRRAMAERRRLNLPAEVEWVQAGRSALLTRYLAEHDENLRAVGRLNVTILFGFSPLLRFPRDYAEFRRVVACARAIGDSTGLRVTVTCGAAVLPQHAADHCRPLDVGPRAGATAGPLERLVAYACHPGSSVDVLRFGMEDTPWILDPGGAVLPATNLMLADVVVRQIALNRAEIVTDPAVLAAFGRASAP